MSRLLRAGTGLGLLLLAATPLQAEGVLTPDQERRVQAGEIVVRIDAADRPVVVVGLVEAPPEQTFRVYADFANYAQVFGLAESQVTHSEGNTIMGRFTMDFPWPLGRRWTLHETTMDPDRFTFTFKRREGSFKLYDGTLQILSEPPNRSRVIYAARIDPDLPVPPWLVHWAQERVFPDVIRNVRSFLAKQEVKP